MEQRKFSDWDLDGLDDAFGLAQIPTKECELLERWETLSKKQEVSDTKREVLLELQEPLQWAGKAWNEAELENKFISPLITISKIDDREIGYFLERKLSAKVGNYALSGTVDGMIATGLRNPKLPFFCMHEYKRSIENAGFPDAQALAAMLAAREMNNNEKPIYGLYIVGLIWNFMVLNGDKYCISRNYDSSTESIFDIFKMFKALKHIIKAELL